jgi:homoserine kinase type II
MAVFTSVTLDDLNQWIKQFPLGKALALQGISSGIENSNFFLTTERGEFVLTIFENLGFEQLPFYVQLMRHLAERGVPVPAPVPNDRANWWWRCTASRPPSSASSRAARRWIRSRCIAPKSAPCWRSMHLAGRDFPLRQPNLRGLDWWIETVPKVLPFLDAGKARLLESELAFQREFAAGPPTAQLARGPVHADLFRNNVMFVGERLSGCFDFYFAGCDSWLFDIAVTVNDWCIDLATGRLDEDRVRALTRAYHACVRSPRPKPRPGSRCCAPRRCASGCRACTTFTVRARPRC